MPTLKIGVPKGSLQGATTRLFEKAGYKIYTSSRSYSVSFDEPEFEGMLLRPQEMALYVERGVLDVGLAGKDWVTECGADVHVVAELIYSRATNRAARWVLAVAEGSSIERVEDVDGKVIYTELVNTTREWLGKHGITADVRFSHGVTEAKIPYLGDAVVELTETGSSLRENNLRIVADMMETSTVLVANRQSWQESWKRDRTHDLVMLLQGALTAESKVGIKLNAPTQRLNDVIAQLPAMKEPTISPLANDEWIALETIVDRNIVRDLIPLLRRAGAQDIIEYPLNKVIP